jgi:hypothetical protein
MNSKLDTLTVTTQQNKVQLLTHSSAATMHLCEQVISIPRELLHGNQIFLAQLSCLDAATPTSLNIVHPKVQHILITF